MLELGILADDLTGGMMAASLLESEGVKCPLVSSIEALADLDLSIAQAVVVARKIRLIEPDLAVNEARKAVRAMANMGVSRFYYKYCATFDSTDRGNIGPVAEAMQEAIGSAQTLFCPAFPRHTVTVFQGRMFLGATPLGESFKQFDPVTPMTNSNLVEVLQSQSSKEVGLIPHNVLARGVEAVNDLIGKPGAPRLFVVDAVDDEDLQRICHFALGWSLTTGADALPVFLARAWQQKSGVEPDKTQKTVLPPSPGREAVIAGSCAPPTLRQISHFGEQHPVFRVDLLDVGKPADYVNRILAWARSQPGNEPIAIATSADASAVEQNQQALGRAGASSLADNILGAVAQGLFASGFRKFVVAGGETSGQVINSLGISQVEVSAFDELGGGYCHQSSPEPISLVLKAGALGQEDFCFRALERMRLADSRKT